MGNSSVKNKSRSRVDDTDSEASAITLTAKQYESMSVNDYYTSYQGGTVPTVKTKLVVPGIEIDKATLPTVFRWDGQGKNVYISGSFDNWTTKIPLVKSRHDFFTIVDLPEGEHQYKYFVDDQWVCDNKESRLNNDFGTENNVIDVKSTDFEVFEALGVDSVDTGHFDENLLHQKHRPASPPGDYCQVIPAKEPHGVHRSGPPILPPHLLQVPLNKEVPSHCDPCILPEPESIMVNHLYALSIKDGIMVLSATIRYRKKYITTLLYKPI